MRWGISATYGSDRLLYVVDLRVDGFFRIVDRLCGGRPARVALDSSANKRLQVVLLLLLFDLLLTFGFFVYSLSGLFVHPVSAYRSAVLLCLSLGSLYFVLRARLGYVWAFGRLRLFAKIAPLIALATLAFSGLYPSWEFKLEQVLFSVILFTSSIVLESRRLIWVFFCPAKT
ncbi:MAG: hypothetical protein NKF39_01570 [Tropheryma whipplei]|uniref:Uncharacterized protein n=1 Tax=Tropheryma whipplei (strain Twist) TaxID=203267 RepID=Q83GM8_TROWT|nr:hypothetical protein [Tropheryma whipplei]AAO44330.1 unknown [Tropheryma whipplei str. Twist]MCO8182595.1 hypothetical protein [Tropheryma whipplei]MCO8190272.1 hypothetical protein [Tropheryma whipplei]CAD67204.1 putative integral membrane protein [Tropheryma whipplei TW08/27]